MRLITVDVPLPELGLLLKQEERARLYLNLRLPRRLLDSLFRQLLNMEMWDKISDVCSSPIQGTFSSNLTSLEQRQELLRFWHAMKKCLRFSSMTSTYIGLPLDGLMGRLQMIYLIHSLKKLNQKFLRY